MKKILGAVAAVVMLWSCENPAGTNNGENQPPEIRYKPGIYTASAQGYGGGVELSLEFSKSAIIVAVLGGHEESITRETVRTALKRIPQMIVEKQSAAVDMVSGATLTSRALLSAAADCIEQAEASKEADTAAPAAGR